MPVPSTIPSNAVYVLGFAGSGPYTFFVGYTSGGNEYFYTTAGPGWAITDSPSFNTLGQMSTGGRDVTTPLMQNPLHHFKLEYNYLSNNPANIKYGNPDTDYRLVYSFYCTQLGRFGEFLYQPRGSAFTYAPLAAPDANGYVELVIQSGPFFAESVQEVNSVPPTIYVCNPSNTPPTYTDVTSTCTFYTAGSVAPYSGIVFTSTTTLTGAETFVMSGNYFYRVAFDKDSYSFEEFWNQAMTVGIGLQQTRI
jgi:hypothetical protein